MHRTCYKCIFCNKVFDIKPGLETHLNRKIPCVKEVPDDILKSINKLEHNNTILHQQLQLKKNQLNNLIQKIALF